MTVFLLLCALVGGAALAGEPVNPHGQRESCALCHSSVSEGTRADLVPFAVDDGDATCHSCHPEGDPHQIGIVPARVEVPADFPLAQGKLACFSCHDEPACSGDAIDDDNPRFFRGGPYVTSEGLCAQCHRWRDLEGELNPHAVLRAGEAEEELCLNCHTGGRTGEAMPDGRPRNEGNICLSCHRPLPHAGSSKHMGQVPEYMKATIEASGLPLRSGDQIVCRSCHDPHPEGNKTRHVVEGATVVPDWWAQDVLEPGLATYEEGYNVHLDPVLIEPYYIRLPLTGGELCLGCHDTTLIEAERKRKRKRR